MFGRFFAAMFQERKFGVLIREALELKHHLLKQPQPTVQDQSNLSVPYSPPITSHHQGFFMKSILNSLDCTPKVIEKVKGQFEESGWRAESINADTANIDSIFLYAFDYKTRWTWCGVLSRDKFDMIIKEVNCYTKAEISAFVAKMISDCLKAKEVDPVMVNMLAYSLALYIASTQTYEQTQRGRTHVHFIVIHYGQLKKIRPMATVGERFQIKSAAETVKAIFDTIEIDKRNHPDWF